MQERKTLNGITLELYENARRFELRGMMKIQGEEMWATLPLDSRDEFDHIPKDIMKAVVMSCARSYFYAHVCRKGSNHEMEDIEPCANPQRNGQ